MTVDEKDDLTPIFELASLEEPEQIPESEEEEQNQIESTEYLSSPEDTFISESTSSEKIFSEHIITSDDLKIQNSKELQVPFHYHPYTLRIFHFQKKEEEKKIVELLKMLTKNIFQSEDLKNQIETLHEITLPRIPEGLCLRIIDTLRHFHIHFSLSESDSLGDQIQSTALEENHQKTALDEIPIFNLSSLSIQSKEYEVIDSFFVTQSLKNQIVENPNSVEFEEALEKLKKELRYKAYRKKTDALYDFKFQIEPILGSEKSLLQLSATGLRKIDSASANS